MERSDRSGISRLTHGTTEWPQLSAKPDPRAGGWLWSRPKDLLLIAGGASLLFALVAVPLTLAIPHASSWLVVAFLHAAVLCNYPHYAASYGLIVRERAKSPGPYRALALTTPVAIAITAFGIAHPTIIDPIVRIYLTWSAYHYAAQHFGIASMYQARAGKALAPDEKRWLRFGFVAVALHLMVLFNTDGGIAVDGGYGLGSMRAFIPAAFGPLAPAFALAGVGAYAIAELRVRRRTGSGLGTAARLLFATNFIWFVVPFIHVPGHAGPWTGNAIAGWVPFALPFFHCVQYLGVSAWRARTTGPVKPMYAFMAMVVLGLALFEGLSRLAPRVSGIAPEQAFVLIPAMLNLHHFFLDGLMWKSKKKPAPVATPASASA